MFCGVGGSSKDPVERRNIKHTRKGLQMTVNLAIEGANKQKANKAIYFAVRTVERTSLTYHNKRRKSLPSEE